MEVDDGAGGTTKPFSDAMLPSLLRAKVEYSAFDIWKALSEKDQENWDIIQVTFLRTAENHFGATHDTTTKFRSANQKTASA
eukprot:5942947-Ditylum_brightwellii.AAC.1